MADEKIKRGPGRPTDKRKDTVLRLRIDAETHKKLNRCAEKRQVSMSEIVREAINEIVQEAEAVVKPAEPNGYKFETLALDMIAFMGTCLPFEVEREKEFAPIKNATGNDSIDSARELLKQNGYTL